MSTQPTLVIVPGSFSTSDMYEPIFQGLRSKGYNIHILDPPCYPKNYKAGSGNPPPTMYDDAKFINEFVGKLVEKGEDVVLLPHSYGGCPSSEALRGITQRERSQKGEKGGVVRVAYLTACVPRLGENLGQVIKGGAPPIEVGEDGWMRHTDPAATGAICFNGLSLERQSSEALRFGRHSGPSFANELTHNGYKDVPVSWFFCEDDLCVVPEVQQTAIDAIEESWYAEGGRLEGKERKQKVDVTRVKCDHVPLLSAEAELLEWVEGVVALGGRE